MGATGAPTETDEETVITIASAWSLNPLRISLILDPTGVGWVGTLVVERKQRRRSGRLGNWFRQTRSR